jgi:hypothetical protein
VSYPGYGTPWDLPSPGVGVSGCPNGLDFGFGFCSVRWLGVEDGHVLFIFLNKLLTLLFY